MLKENFPGVAGKLPSSDMTGGFGYVSLAFGYRNCTLYGDAVINDHSPCDHSTSMAKLTSWFQPSSVGQYIRTNIGKPQVCDNSKIKKELGMEFRPIKQTLIDTENDLMRWGHLPDFRVRQLSAAEAKEWDDKMRAPNGTLLWYCAQCRHCVIAVQWNPFAALRLYEIDTPVYVCNVMLGLPLAQHSCVLAGSYPSSFLGKELVAWLQAQAPNEIKSRDSAVRLAEALYAAGAFTYLFPALPLRCLG